MEILERTYLLIASVTQRILGLLEIFLFIRFLLRFLGASQNAIAVNLIYKYSDILIFPFKFIFPDIALPRNFLIDTATVSAMIGYAILAFVFLEVLKLFSTD